MSAEFYIKFEPHSWYVDNSKIILQELFLLKSFKVYQANIVYLKATSMEENNWVYDVRIVFLESSILFEISAKNERLTMELKQLFSQLRERVSLRIEDEDGEKVNW